MTFIIPPAKGNMTMAGMTGITLRVTSAILRTKVGSLLLNDSATVEEDQAPLGHHQSMMKLVTIMEL